MQLIGFVGVERRGSFTKAIFFIVSSNGRLDHEIEFSLSKFRGGKFP